MRGAEVGRFLQHLAVNRSVAASPQNRRAGRARLAVTGRGRVDRDAVDSPSVAPSEQAGFARAPTDVVTERLPMYAVRMPVCGEEDCRGPSAVT